MQERVVYVMTHDSIGLGEDGPTHQPVEHLASLRAIPGLTVLRPADGHETVAAWRQAITHDGPSLLALTRQGLPDLGERPDAPMERGGYVLRDVAPSDAGEVSRPDVVLIGTGSEVQLCVEAAEMLAADGIAARVVSMLSVETFLAQEKAYRDEVLPPGVTARVAVEAGITLGWERIVGDRGRIIGLDHFGASAPAGRIFEEFGFTGQAVADAARASLGAED